MEGCQYVNSFSSPSVSRPDEEKIYFHTGDWGAFSGVNLGELFFCARALVSAFMAASATQDMILGIAFASVCVPKYVVKWTTKKANDAITPIIWSRRIVSFEHLEKIGSPLGYRASILDAVIYQNLMFNNSIFTLKC